MELDSLLAISPIDGRYAGQTRELSNVFSEYGLIKNRIIVEIEWLKMLAGEQDIAEVPPLSSDAIKFLDRIISDFKLDDAARVKEIEKTTNHDVKAIEYFLKEKVAGHKELHAINEFIHFACTSEDINNLAYALMLKDARANVVLPVMTQV
ncbi:MAG: lyase family protein, partial [Gammaproteobacteria bacterium]